MSGPGALVGRSIGPYRVDELLGEGGMGAVYRAQDTRLGRPVALKMIRSDLALRPEARARLTREARAAAKVSHPGIATLLDFGEAEDGQLYLVFELLDGRSLRKVAEQRRLSTVEVIDMGIRLADALAAAHARGVVHRDVKPDNVMVTSLLDVKMLDFGLAKLDRPSDGDDPTGEGFHTREGVIVGTPHYMAPEQLEGRDVDGRTDLFALGVVLYELLTGRRPFDGSTTAAEVANVLRGHPQPLRQFNPDVSEGLEAIVLRCLRRDPALRFQSAGELAVALRGERERLDSGARALPVEPEYYLNRATARFLFQLLQATYLAMYVAAFNWGDSLGEAFAYVAAGALTDDAAQGLAIAAMLLALIGFGVRLYLIGIVAVDHARTGVYYTRAFPYFFVLDELWALMPLALAKDNPAWLALTCVPLLVYAPFSQRTLIRSAYDVERGGRASTPSIEP